MARAQDLLDEAIASLSDAGHSELADRLTAQREKFFFTSLAGVPLANKVKNASAGITAEADTSAVADLVSQIEDKADAPGTVLT